MAVVVDAGINVRVPRAYLAGFGTSGSLLAGGALMFILASAIVAFRGWPQITGGAPVTSISVTRGADATTSQTGRILQAPGTAAVLTAALHGAAAGAIPPSAGAVSSRGAGGGAGGGEQGTGASGGGGTSTERHPSCAGSACVSGVEPPPGLTALGQQVLAQTAQQAGSAVSVTTSTAADALAPVSQSAASTIRKLGSSTAKATTGLTSSAAHNATTSPLERVATSLTGR